MKIRRALTTAAPLAMAGALGLGTGAATASAAALPVQLPSLQLPLLNGLNLGSTTSPLSGVTGTVNSLLGGVGVQVPALPALGGAPASNAPAPAGSLVSHAAANALNLGVIGTCVSCTSAAAGPSSSQSGAHALTVLGQDLSAGSTSSNGSNSGNLIALPANGLLGLAVADWMNSAKAGANGSDASSRSALTDLNLGNGQIATIALLEAMSHAANGGSSASGDAATNGADISLLNGAVALILLHSDVAADGTQTAYVASLNGQQLLATHGNSGGLPITIPGVGTINILQSGANGGQANTAIGTISDLLGTAGQAAGVMTAEGGPAASTASTGNGSSSTAAPHQPSTGAAHIPSAAGTGASTPNTGVDLGLGGLALVAGGISVLAATARRRRSADTV
ncbi:MAG TPA: hypothetical protein VMU20_16190 [Candidatus Dormibacteraeota bacterium]|nr:hypothetical protein [Candidatus Dormibacteraeota bacterium]